MTLHRIEHALVMDTDDIPGRGGYAVVGISRHVAQADRAFIAGNFGISDYLHDPKTENRIFYSVFRMPSGRRAFVRRFARGTELRRNNTQRRLVVHTLLLDEDAWCDLFALPWLLLNARLQIMGTDEIYRLSTDVPPLEEESTLPALVWDSGDGAVSGVAGKLSSRLSLAGSAPSELIARIITALGRRPRVTLPQDPGFEWATLLAWSMLPRHDRDELAWTQHDAMNLSGVSFSLANAVSPDLDLSAVEAAAYAHELVRMNTESEDSWLDVQERTTREPLTARRPADLDAWIRWREALLRLRRNIKASEAQVVAYMGKLADVAKGNRNAAWVDDEEVLHLVWANVRDDIASGNDPAVAARSWGTRLRASGLGDVTFRAAPGERWLTQAAADVGADPLVWFFLSGGGEDPEAKEMRAALAEWLVRAHIPDVSSERLVVLAFLLAADRSDSLRPLVGLLLERPAGLDALLAYLRERQGGVALLHAALPVVLRRAYPNTLAFLREVFVPRFDAARVDAETARQIAGILRHDSAAFRRFADRAAPDVRTELLALVGEWLESDPGAALPLARELFADLQRQGSYETAVPLAIALANAGEPARTWFNVLVRVARPQDARESAATRELPALIERLDPKRINLKGAMEWLVPLLEQAESAESLRALVRLTRPVWESGGQQFVRAVRRLIDHAPLPGAWESIVVDYVADHRHKRPGDASELAAAFWAKAADNPAQLAAMSPRVLALLDVLDRSGVERLKTAWNPKLGVLPRGEAATRLLAVIRDRSYEQEIALAKRDIDQGVAKPWTLNRLDEALDRLYGGRSRDMLADDVLSWLGADGPAARLARLLDLLASDEILPTVRLTIQTRVLGKTLKAMKRRHWKELRTAAREEDLLALGAVVRLAYAVGARADGRTTRAFEEIWSAHRRRDALDALAAGRRSRAIGQRLARALRLKPPPALAR